MDATTARHNSGPLMPASEPQSVANLVWAYATLAQTHSMVVLACVTVVSSDQGCAGKLHEGLMDAAARHNSGPLMAAFQPQSVANLVWAYATLAHKPPDDFLELLCGHAQQQLYLYSPQNISNTVWALATLKHYHQVCAINCSRLDVFLGVAVSPCSARVAFVLVPEHWQHSLSPCNTEASPSGMRNQAICVRCMLPELLCGHSQRDLHLYSALNISNTL